MSTAAQLLEAFKLPVHTVPPADLSFPTFAPPPAATESKTLLPCGRVAAATSETLARANLRSAMAKAPPACADDAVDARPPKKRAASRRRRGFLFLLPYLLQSLDAPGDHQKRFQCDGCDQKFTRNSNLTRHRRIHKGEKRFGCSRCKKTFMEKHHLAAHERTHTGEKPFACPCCQRAFTDRSNMLRHVRTHPDYEGPLRIGSSVLCLFLFLCNPVAG